MIGLDDVSYGMVHSNILAIDPLPSLNRVYATLVQEKRMKIITKCKEEREAVMGFAVKRDIGPRGEERRRINQWGALTIER